MADELFEDITNGLHDFLTISRLRVSWMNLPRSSTFSDVDSERCFSRQCGIPGLLDEGMGKREVFRLPLRGSVFRCFGVSVGALRLGVSVFDPALRRSPQYWPFNAMASLPGDLQQDDR
ncbi:MAG: hypothetical protein K9N23_20990 [Akkermansiaceae bacterium]|nr:hypothetical protein [Akkermansiaceae bacterium]